MIAIIPTRLRISFIFLLLARGWIISLGWVIALQPDRLCAVSRTSPRFGSLNRLLASSNGASSELESKTESVDYRIRDCTYSELNQVADVIIAAFYSKAKNPWRQLYRMGELNRVQQAYPYKKSDHRMFVAVVQAENALRDEKIVGFVDVDNRQVMPSHPSPYKYNPRPYLSDLCVHPDFHRKGVARSMVKACEKFCLEDLEKEELFIRVEETNEPALNMYQSMGYTKIENPDTGTILLLRKSLVTSESEARQEDTDCLVEQHERPVEIQS